MRVYAYGSYQDAQRRRLKKRNCVELPGTAWYWFVGGVDPAIYAKAKATEKLNELPTNYNPHFAPVMHPTWKPALRR